MRFNNILVNLLLQKVRSPAPQCVVLAICLSLWAGTVALASNVNSASWTLSADGAVAFDVGSKLLWSRCPEGMPFVRGLCTGSPVLMVRTTARSFIADRNAKLGTLCRLPSVGELQNFARSNMAGQMDNLNPQIAEVAQYRWSGTPVVKTTTANQYNYGNIAKGVSEQNAMGVGVSRGWAVRLDTGESREDFFNALRLPIQFVCPLKE